MNPDRDYLSVTIPVHSYFSVKTKKSEKDQAYETRILECLSTPLTLTELSAALGYKGITQKLRTAIAALQNSGKITTIAVGKSVKYTI